MIRSKRPLSVAAACGLAYFAATSGVAQAQEQNAQRQGAVSLRDVDIRAFIEDVSNATGRTFIVDPRVTGRVSVVAHESLNERELFDLFMSTLRVNGFVAVPTASGAYRILPDSVAAREPGSPRAGPSENRYVAQVFTLRYADAEGVANAIRPMLSERGQVTANRRGNSIVVVDYGSTITRLQEVVGRLDSDTSSFRSLRLRNTSAAEMARVAQGLAQAVGDDSGRSLVQIVPVTSSNTLVLRGDPRSLEQLVPVLQELDTQADYQSGVQVVRLRYAVAEELVPVLQQISSAMTSPQENGAPTAGRRANIAAHRATNSLIISADPETQEALANVVRELDVRREQILVEAIIVEVSDDAARELGLQLVAGGDGTNAVPFLSTNYGSANAPNILALTGALLLDGDDDDDNAALQDLRRAAVSSLLGSRGSLVGIGGTTNDGKTTFGLILNALADDQESNVLSTPSVMTLDNETASILVGQQIPITTGETLSSSNDNPFRTIERQDVGVQLEVRPQISEGGAIRLNIRQEVSSIFGTVITDSTDLITNRRAIETVVQVDAGEIIVLGGLIQEDVQRSNSGIPGLRSIPGIGRLFRSEGTQRRRTNLMVFLRPTVVTSQEQIRAMTDRQYRSFRDTTEVDRGVGALLERQFQNGLANPSNLPPQQ
ncbi:MAG: type II secretion system protein GspD [Alphaproteobacteria bacterium]|nr:type II secretion system protein GspD [Alphaproteobacteria bacterium]